MGTSDRDSFTSAYPTSHLKSIANNAEIDVIWEKFQAMLLEPLREQLNDALGTSYEEWEIPARRRRRLAQGAVKIHANWWAHRIARQKEIDASIAAKADYEYLYDKPYEDKRKVRVAGPFTVESLLPHRVLGVDENDELIDNVAEAKLGYGEKQDFAGVVLDHLKISGVQQAHKEDRISFSGIKPGRVISSAPRGSTSRAAPTPAPRSAPPSSSAPNSAPSPVPIWCKPPVRLQTPTLMS